MLRFLGPLLFFAAAAYVHHYNGSHTDSALLFPLVGVLPWVEGLEAEKAWSVYVLAGIGSLWAVLEIVAEVVRRIRVKQMADDS